ncbi:peptide MFS transporter [Legionella maioricensis]|uniref:Oligopeptide:H+ symporter n=1 Tax=Legionella maioricensis TaxID=2896528 RepID=A0A9X2IBP1_9GAMM|nr:oligopeptide:H+ symporter [Legionella maioricensis]MCL9683587.1 oligopeptide:H+ symporter [Legionella maioricensis]MCL9686886.1 oligopeptide:H+ symporter [Legionella maioricensis]
MISQAVKNYLPELNLRQKQTNNIIFITFWSQFSVYALNTVLVLFLTRPLIAQGLGYSQAKAYAFIGVTQATGYLMPILGGYMADSIVGVRRSILLGSIMLACAYLLVMLSGFTIGSMGDQLFIAAFAFIPATNSLLMGTASSMVSHIYSDDAIKAKSAMTYYYMAINVGGLLAALIAPVLLDSRYGPLSILTLTFVGKSIAALNFAKRYSLYDTVIWGKDKSTFSKQKILRLTSYIAVIYALTLFAYSHVYIASTLISVGCTVGIFWFLAKTMMLKGETRSKQMIALLLIIEAVVFFIIYNQMNTTIILFAQSNSNHNLLGLTISPAQYQMLNPLLILLIGSQLPRFYRFFPRFTIPYQFASGTMLAGVSLLVMAFAAHIASEGIVNGNYIALTYILITIAELWVSAIGLSMIGLYCDGQAIAFAMGVWYLASSMANAISGRIAGWVAIPENITSPVDSLPYYKSYYLIMGISALVIGILMYYLAFLLQRIMKRKGINLA